MIEIKKFNYKNKKLMKIAHNISYDVFVMGQKCPEEIEWEFEEESTHFIVYNNSEAVATARHRRTEKGYKLERFAVRKKNRGKGYGHIVLKEILKDLNGITEMIYMHAQIQVLPFYEKLGFIKMGESFEEAGIIHYKMILEHRDL